MILTKHELSLKARSRIYDYSVIHCLKHSCSKMYGFETRPNQITLGCIEEFMPEQGSCCRKAQNTKGNL
jgi:hypothetical protein